MPRLCFALDLNDDAALIAEYERWHQPDQIWPQIVESISSAGIRELEIFRVDDRLFMVMDVAVDFSPAAKAAADANIPHVQTWEAMMWKFQKPLANAKPGEKWVPMKRIFSLTEARSVTSSK